MAWFIYHSGAKLSLIFNKCGVLHISKDASIPPANHTINNCPLSIATTQRDLGINAGIVQFSWSVHNNYILFSKAYRVLNLIRRTIPAVPHSVQRRHCIYLLFVQTYLIIHRSGDLSK